MNTHTHTHTHISVVSYHDGVICGGYFRSRPESCMYAYIHIHIHLYMHTHIQTIYTYTFTYTNTQSVANILNACAAGSFRDSALMERLSQV